MKIRTTKFGAVESQSSNTGPFDHKTSDTMQLIDEIIRDLVDENANLPNILRKGKILANELRLKEFRNWIEFELDGYPSMDDAPSYRSFKPENYGTFTGPWGSSAKNVILPTFGLEEPVKSFAEQLTLTEGVAALTEMLSSESGGYSRPWPQEAIFLARDKINMSGDMILVEAHQPVSPNVISGILDSIKNKLMDFVLDLKDKDVTTETLRNGTLKREVALNSFNTHIYGNQNVVATGVNVHQEITPVEQGDIQSLLNALRELNLADEDLRELHTAVASEPTAEKDSFGSKVNAWIGKMAGKAASGTLKYGVDQTTIAIMQALNSYYGY